jgi:3-hydroxypropanoate dehydrogenase
MAIKSWPFANKFANYSDNMTTPISNDALDVLFRQARTHNAWLDKPVGDHLQHQLWALMKYGPTSANSNPARILFLRTKEAKQRLLPALSPTNADKTMQAPVTAIIGCDFKFFEHTPKLFPNNPAMRDNFANNQKLAEITAFRNGTLQGAYMMLAARALGLDCGPMSGFDNAKVDAEFFSASAGNPPAFIDVKSNFLCNIGYGHAEKLFPRNPRLTFDQACRLL